MPQTPANDASRDWPQAAALLLMALEWMPDAATPAPVLTQTQAGALLERIGHDLALLVPEVATLDVVMLGAHFDPAEVLRPGWPVHRRLHALHARAPRAAAPRLIAIGADAAGDVPQPLHAEDALRGGPLRVLPLLLVGDAAAGAAAQLEELLLDRGMARAETALLAQDAFATRIEHARYLTVHDLLAMTALQYEHMGLAPLWPVLQTALLAAGERCDVDAPPEPHVRYAEGVATIPLLTPEAWRARNAVADEDPARLTRQLQLFEARQRQFAAVLQAHGIDVLFDGCNGDAAPAH